MRDPETVLADRASQDPSFRERVNETIELHGLLDHPGWLALKKHFENGKEGYGRELTAQLLAGVPVNQREIDERRGMLKMAEAIFAYPEIALSNLERTARRLMDQEFEQEVALEASRSPYIDGERDV